MYHGTPFAAANNCRILSHCFQIGIEVLQFVRACCGVECISNISHVLGFGTFMVPVEEAIYVVCEITCLEV
jgi:hypothetical protein